MKVQRGSLKKKLSFSQRKAIFDEIDSDKDGNLNRDEFSRYLRNLKA